MVRGTRITWVSRWSPIGWGIARSSDGDWSEGGRPIPWLWFKLRTTHKAPGFSLRLGEYMISVGWVGW